MLTALKPILRTPWLAPLNDAAALDDLLAQVNPLWSVRQIKARVVAVRDETADVRTLLLAPNRHWHGFRAGQHIVVDVEIDGVRHQRSYSLSSSPTDRETIAITVKRQRGGKVSNALHDRIKVGDVLGLSAPVGDFTLPAIDGPVLLLSAGSGITPLMSMLRDLRARVEDRDVFFLHICRTPEEAIFAADLHAIAAAMPGLKLHFHYTGENGRLPLEALSIIVPDYAERATLLCGPAGFMADVRAKWEREGIASKLSCEYFGIAPIVTSDAASVEVRASRSERVFTASAAKPLLIEAETAGLKPRHGCRIGICQSCKCRKTSGTVQNLRTGEISSEPNEMIQLCVSAARSDVQLEI